MFIVNHIREAFREQPIPNQDRLPPHGESILESLSNDRLLSGKKIAYKGGIAYLVDRHTKVRDQDAQHAAAQISRELRGEVARLAREEGLPNEVNLKAVLSNLKTIQDLGGGRAAARAIQDVKELKNQKHAEANVIGRGAVRYGLYQLIKRGTFKTGLVYLGGGLATAGGAVLNALGITAKVLKPVTDGIGEGLSYLGDKVGIVDLNEAGAATLNVPNLAGYILTVVEFLAVTEAFSLSGHVIRKVTPKSVQRVYKNNMPKSAYNALNFYVFYTPKSRARFYDNLGSGLANFSSNAANAIADYFA